MVGGDGGGDGVLNLKPSKPHCHALVWAMKCITMFALNLDIQTPLSSAQSDRQTEDMSGCEATWLCIQSSLL